MLSDVMLYVVMLYAAMLSVVLPNVVMLGATGPVIVQRKLTF